MAVYRCSVCKKTGEWTTEWSWYGSYRELDNFGGDAMPKVCSEVCKAKWAAKNAKLVEANEAAQRPRRRSR